MRQIPFKTRKREGIRMSDTIQIEHAGARTIVRLNRPDVHNAFDDRMIAELTQAFRQLADNTDARAVVLCGEGKSFSAGADMNWMRRMKDYSQADNERDAAAMADMFRAMRGCPLPIIARVHGAAIGGGAGLVAATDIAIATTSATFALSEVRVGMIPAVISPLVIERIGVTAARRYMLTGARFDGAAAQRIGLVAELVDSEAELDERIDGLVSTLEKCGPVAVAACKKLINDVAQRPADDLFDETVRRIAALRVSDEGQEGFTAFLEKRAPNWTHRSTAPR
jgi:methylglutaconyl-CoA hydratase